MVLIKEIIMCNVGVSAVLENLGKWMILEEKYQGKLSGNPFKKSKKSIILILKIFQNIVGHLREICCIIFYFIPI